MSKISEPAPKRPLLARLLDLIESPQTLLVPPFKGMSAIVFLSLVLMGVSGLGSVWRGHLHDPDNYLYLVQALDWLQGQSWFDPVQYRMNPPAGTVIHYSHLLVSIYGASIFMLKPFLGVLPAAFTTAAIFPLVYFALFLLVAHRLGQALIGKEWGDATALFIVFSPHIMSRFLPGHIDHHSLEALLALLALTTALRLIQKPTDLALALFSGATLGLALALALEATAVLLLLSLCLGVWAVIEGGAAARSAAVFGLTLFLTSTCLLFLTRRSQNFFDIELLSYSIVYVILTANIALCFAGAAVVRNRPVPTRFIATALLAVATGGMFLSAFPSLASGPYGGMDEDLKRLIFALAPEAWPGTSWGGALWAALVLTASGLMLIRAPSKAARWSWGIILLMFSGCYALSALYQNRFALYAELFAVFPLAAAVRLCWESRDRSQTRKRALAGLMAFVGLAPLTLASTGIHKVAVPAIAKASSKGGCDQRGLANMLNDKSRWGQEPRLIINSINEGPEILLRTPHAVLAAPYHTNVDGNLDAYRFFSSPDPQEAKAIVQKRRADLVVACRRPSQLRLYLQDAKGQKPFVEQLMEKRIPDWLKPVDAPQLGNFMVFKVVLPR
jgi:asparagine N-glycosylation enzyme membrane subunit Stt3